MAIVTIEFQGEAQDLLATVAEVNQALGTVDEGVATVQQTLMRRLNLTAFDDAAANLERSFESLRNINPLERIRQQDFIDFATLFRATGSDLFEFRRTVTTLADAMDRAAAGSGEFTAILDELGIRVPIFEGHVQDAGVALNQLFDEIRPEQVEQVAPLLELLFGPGGAEPVIRALSTTAAQYGSVFEAVDAAIVRARAEGFDLTQVLAFDPETIRLVERAFQIVGEVDATAANDLADAVQRAQTAFADLDLPVFRGEFENLAVAVGFVEDGQLGAARAAVEMAVAQRQFREENEATVDAMLRQAMAAEELVVPLEEVQRTTRGVAGDFLNTRRSLRDAAAGIAGLFEFPEVELITEPITRLADGTELPRIEEGVENIDRAFARLETAAAAALATIIVDFGRASSAADTLLRIIIQIAAEALIGSALGSLGLPGFQRGGFHTGGLALVGEHGPEIIATGPARIFSADETARILGQMDGGVTLNIDARGTDEFAIRRAITESLPQIAAAVRSIDARGNAA